jgi:HAD superfamily hydrolase (TIGR01484 family)
MNVVIFSGGTGSIALQQGLKKLNPNIKITNIINAYDDGKSTGVCRKVFNVLGPSDIRKNQWTQYLNSTTNVNKVLEELFISRIDLSDPKFNAEDYVNSLKLETVTGGEELKKWAENSIADFFYFLPNSGVSKEELKDFSVINIVYAFQFTRWGIDRTIHYFSEILGIEDNVILNSSSNYWLSATTLNNKKLNWEHEIVDYGNSEDPISYINFRDTLNPESQIDSNEELIPELNYTAREEILNADILVFSAGTQWASLIPTYMTKGFSDAISSNTTATKIFILNTVEDTDMLGVSATDTLNHINQYLSFNDIDIVFNTDGDLKFGEEDFRFPILKAALGNNNGKHDPDKLARFVYQRHYQLENYYDKPVIFDFDDTLYSRDSEELPVSLQNVNLMNSLGEKSFVAICSGNSYERLKGRLFPIVGPLDYNFRLFCDGGLVEYVDEKIVNSKKLIDSKFLMDTSAEYYEMVEDAIEKISSEPEEFTIEFRGEIDNYLACFSITGMKQEFRTLMYYYLKATLKEYPLNIRLTGRGSIDITIKEYDKNKLFEISNLNKDNCLYIGDETEQGNDENIAKIVSHKIQVSSPYETNCILKLLLSNPVEWTCHK